MIIATAGHVDHGKTMLVKALTGIDTDTLEEEKRRGLTINLGFAYLPVPGHPAIGFIDVPGHSRFIRNALCGLAATDFVLLVVAADDGPMAQTREHLAIIDLLDCREVALVITKIDRVSAERVAQVRKQVQQMAAAAGLKHAPCFAVSASSGHGIEALRDLLLDKRHGMKQNQPVAPVDSNFRLAVDRTFQVKGAGLVVTGTIFAGAVAVGDTVSVAGVSMQMRVRGLRAQNEQASFGVRGQRCALNLSGPELRPANIQRGSWITAPGAADPVHRFDASLRITTRSRRPFAHWTPVHLHLGASDTTARIAVLEGKQIAPGKTALVQVFTSSPSGAVYGDRFIVRDQSAQYTLGGGHVIDIAPPRRGRARPDRLRALNAMNTSSTAAALSELLAVSQWGVDLDQFLLTRNVGDAAAASLLDQIGPAIIPVNQRRLGFAPGLFDQHCATISSEIGQWHRGHPIGETLTATRLAARLQPKWNSALLNGVIQHLVDRQVITSDSGGIRPASAAASLAPEDEALWAGIKGCLARNGLKPTLITELASATGIEAATLNALCGRAGKLGLIERISPTLVIEPKSLHALAALAIELSTGSGDGLVTVPAFRDASGIGRNRTIEVLEHLDARGITVRVADGRRPRPSADKVLARLLQ